MPRLRSNVQATSECALAPCSCWCLSLGTGLSLCSSERSSSLQSPKGECRNNSGSEYHGTEKLSFSKTWLEIMNFQCDILAKSLAKLHFVEIFYPFKNFNDIFAKRKEEQISQIFTRK